MEVKRKERKKFKSQGGGWYQGRLLGVGIPKSSPKG